MKHIKSFEGVEDLVSHHELTPGFMYLHKNEPVCFIGENLKSREYKTLCLVFKKKFLFIEWVNWMNDLNELTPLDVNRPISLKEYIIDNNLVKKTIDAFKKPDFLDGNMQNSGKNIKNMLIQLLDDEELMILYDIEDDVNKYNL
jgi:hypothetical protein